MAACAQCGTALPRGATACPECGTPVPRRAPAKKPAAAKKAPAKKTAAAKAARPPAKPRASARATAPAEPVETPVETPPAETASAEPVEPADPYDTLPGARPVGASSEAPAERAPALWARYAHGDWRAPSVAALVALAATVALGVLAAGSAFVAPEAGDDPPVGEPSFGRWVRVTCGFVGLAFGSSVGMEPVGDGDGFFDEVVAIARLSLVPLSVTLLALAALWLSARRALRDRPDRLADALRTATVFAAGVVVVTAFARLTEDDLRFTVSPWRAAPGAFAAAAAMAWLATTAVPERLRDWTLAARAAALGVGTGVAWGVALLVALAYDAPGETQVETGDVTRGLATAVPFAVNFGTAAFGGLTSLHLRLPSTDETGFWPLWSSEVPAPYLLALLAPVVAVVVAVAYLRRRVPAADLPRLAAMTAAPAALVWLALAVAGAARVWVPVGLGGTVRAGFGATPSHALLVALWFGLGGWLVGRALAGRV